MRAGYPSDVTREQFEVIRYMLESTKQTTRPRQIDIYDIFCAVLYRLRKNPYSAVKLAQQNGCFLMIHSIHFMKIYQSR